MSDKNVKIIDSILKSEEFKYKVSVIDVFSNIYEHKFGVDKLNELNEDIKNIKLDLNKDILDINIDAFSYIYENFIPLLKKHNTASYYTPDEIVDYMVKYSIDQYLCRKMNMKKKHLNLILSKINQCVSKNQLKLLLNLIRNIKVIDISCGTGLFLIKAFKYLKEIKETLYYLLGIEKDSLFEKEILENSLYGIDIQREPIIVCKMCLSSFCSKRQPLDLCNNVYRADSLSNNAYMCAKVKKVIDLGGFHIVLGNPPYLGEKGNKELFEKVKTLDIGKKFYESKMDYFYFFLYRGIELLHGDGILNFITTNYFTTADGAKKLRLYLRENINFLEILNFNECEIFKDAKGQHNIVYSMVRKKKDESVHIKTIKKSKFKLQDILKENKDFIEEFKLDSQKNLYGLKNKIFIQGHVSNDSILRKMITKKDGELGEFFNVNQGIVSGVDKITKLVYEKKLTLEELKNNNIKKGEGVFVLNYEELKDKELEGSSYIRRFYKNSHIKRYTALNETHDYIIYVNKEFSQEDSTTLKIKKHLNRFKGPLCMRREVIAKTRPWYGLQWPRNEEIFLKNKILVPQRAKKNVFALETNPWYASADVYFITNDTQSYDKWNFILAQLNSKLMYYWLYFLGKRKGEYLELYSTPLKEIPIILSSAYENQISDLVQSIINTSDEDKYQGAIDEYMYKIYEISNEEKNKIESLYNKIV